MRNKSRLLTSLFSPFSGHNFLSSLAWENVAMVCDPNHGWTLGGKKGEIEIFSLLFLPPSHQPDTEIAPPIRPRQKTPANSPQKDANHFATHRHLRP